MESRQSGRVQDLHRTRHRQRLRLPALMLLITTAVLLMIPTLDQSSLELLRWPQPHPRSDLLQLFRVWGSLWSWLVIGVAIQALWPRDPLGRQRRWLVSCTPLISAAAGGATAEVLKLILRRERPSELVGYTFRSWQENPWSTSGLGLPSSHAAVAFAGSVALGLLLPRLRCPALMIACGCAYTRIAAGAHFPSDVLLGATVGSLVGATVMTRLEALSRPTGNRSPGR